MPVDSLISETYLGSTIPQYLLFFGILGVGAVLGRSLGYVYRRRIRDRAEVTDTEIDDVVLYALGRPVVLLGVVLAAAVGREVLTPVEPIRTVLDVAVEIPVIVLIAWVAVRLTDGIIQTYVGSYAERTESKLDDALVPIVSRMTNIAIVSIAGVVAMDTIGYDVTAIIASLGIGGVALAIASRRTLSDVFGGAHILSTKPFLVDDIVEIGGTAGTVEEIGLRSTRLRDFDGRLITIPNSAVADAEVKNITSEPTRRVKTFIGLSYETDPAGMEAALDLIEEAVNDVDGVDPERTEAWFWEYGDSAMRVRLEYHIDALDEWKAVRDRVNRGVQRALEDAGIEMALAARAVHVRGGESD